MTFPNLREQDLGLFVDRLVQEPEKSPNLDKLSYLEVVQSHGPNVLICGHGNRDSRCGIMGPILKEAFHTYAEALIPGPTSEGSPDLITKIGRPQIGLISHIGGHAWAGNVILYFPRSFRTTRGELSPLASKGVWYGRVGPQHVEGIFNETIQNGRVIEELLRGIHESNDTF